MGQSERLHKIRRILDDGGCARPDRLGFELGVSRSTLKRDIAVLRDRLNAPITWSTARGGWIVDSNQAGAGVQYELPGLWLSAEEIHALLTMQQLLANLDGGGLLGPHIAPLMRRLGQILDGGVPPKAEVARRIHVLTVGARRFDIPHFQAIGSALLRRKREQVVAIPSRLPVAAQDCHPPLSVVTAPRHPPHPSVIPAKAGIQGVAHAPQACTHPFVIPAQAGIQPPNCPLSFSEQPHTVGQNCLRTRRSICRKQGVQDADAPHPHEEVACWAGVA